VKILKSIRVVLRLLELAWVIVSGMFSLAWFLKSGREGEMDARIAWMQWMSRRFLALLHCEVKVVGKVPKSGLIACNHLGYVDILVIGSVSPAVFVAKSDVREWPIFGWLASRAGTIFVSRNAPAQVASQLREMQQPLKEGRPVVLFPEGTSSDGSTVLPLRSSLFESVIATGSPITPAAIGYDLGGQGSVGAEVAYWGDHVLLPHLINLLSKESFVAHLTFGTTRSPMPDRKQEATVLRDEILVLHRTLS
jgi:1-acyl-sn-glycerol-3-phosphate acyltransferase